MDFNFGLFKVFRDPLTKDIETILSVKDLGNNVRLQRKFSVSQDLTF